MNTEHTPGPWERDHNVVRTTRGTIALCPTPQNGGTFDCAANARLIAAAPDMLAALKLLVAEDSGLFAAPDAWAQRTMDMARTAIAKAEGRGE